MVEDRWCYLLWARTLQVRMLQVRFRPTGLSLMRLVLVSYQRTNALEVVVVSECAAADDSVDGGCGRKQVLSRLVSKWPAYLCSSNFDLWHSPSTVLVPINGNW